MLTSPAQSLEQYWEYWENYGDEYDGLYGYDWDYDYYRPGMAGHSRDSNTGTQDRRWKSDRELK